MGRPRVRVNEDNGLAFRQRLWPAAESALDHIIQASKFGFVKKQKPKLSKRDIQRDVQLVEIENSLKYDEMIIKSLGLSSEGPDDYLMQLAKMSLTELTEVILRDGITPTISSLEELKHYMLLGADYSAIPYDDPGAKKKDNHGASPSSI